ncbi:MAG: RDD family protein [Beijerinckiaceae bacterium]|jgi:uncharacterized RDD family membrane protein YckC
MRNDFHQTSWSVARKSRRGQEAGAADAADDSLEIGDTQVLFSRVCAFGLDFIVVGLLGSLIFALLAVAGLFTFGLSWFALPLAFPLTAFFYNASTVSGPNRGTWGMRAMGLEVVDMRGQPVDFIIAGAHAVLLYVSLMFPPVLLVGLFNDKSRLLHDIATGVLVRRR